MYIIDIIFKYNNLIPIYYILVDIITYKHPIIFRRTMTVIIIIKGRHLLEWELRMHQHILSRVSKSCVRDEGSYFETHQTADICILACTAAEVLTCYCLPMVYSWVV